MNTSVAEDGTLTLAEAGSARPSQSPRPRHRLSRYGPVVFWAVIIFLASTSAFSAAHTSVLIQPLHWLFPNLSAATLDLIHGVIRKGAHFAEYAVFGFLVARAFRTSSIDLLRRHWFLMALLLVMAYSLTDEFHQSFVPSRTASIYDSLIDSVGGSAALAFMVIKTRGRRRLLPDN